MILTIATLMVTLRRIIGCLVYMLYSLYEYPHALYIFLSIVVGIKWAERIPTLGFHIEKNSPQTGVQG